MLASVGADLAVTFYAPGDAPEDSNSAPLHLARRSGRNLVLRMKDTHSIGCTVIAGVHRDRDARQKLSRKLTRISFGLSSMFSSIPIVNETAYEWSFFPPKITGEPATLR
jgi:hypothetical protein